LRMEGKGGAGREYASMWEGKECWKMVQMRTPKPGGKCLTKKKKGKPGIPFAPLDPQGRDFLALPASACKRFTKKGETEVVTGICHGEKKRL